MINRILQGNKIDELTREIEELKKQLKALTDEQVKQRRDTEDLMYNLDNDNLSPTAVIRANHISLNGKTIDLTAGDITINSDNFQVDSSGNLTCTNASVAGHVEATSGSFTGTVYANGGSFANAGIDNCTINNCDIKKTCSIGSDITAGSGVQLGQVYQNQAGTRYSYVDMEFDESGTLNEKGISIRANNKLSSDPVTHSGLQINPTWSALTTNTEVGPYYSNNAKYVAVFQDGDVVLRNGYITLTIGNDDLIIEDHQHAKQWILSDNLP